jgi:hypothetical protein
MTGTTYGSRQMAADAEEYAAACWLLKQDPDDEDALATIAALDKQYGAGFFED